jgi:hypothetical protein
MIFIDNKYTRWYYAIIDKATRRINNPADYLENHHIIPECFYINRTRPGPSGWLSGNPDEISNKVKLTPEEHRVCHLLLVKMTNGKARAKMSLAAYMIHTMSSSNQQRVTNKVYGRLKRLHSEAMSMLTKGVPKSAISNERRSKSLKGISAGITVVKDINGKTYRVPVSDPRILSGELVGITKGKTTVKDSNGMIVSVDSNDPRLLTGELVGVTKGLMMAKDKDNNTRQVAVDDPRVLSGELVHILHGITPSWVGKKKQCLYCLDEFDLGNYAQYHGEKCPAKFGLPVPNFREYNKRIRIKEKKIIIDNIVYKSLSEASQTLSLKMATIHYRLNSKNFINYQYWSDDKIPSASLI